MPQHRGIIVVASHELIENLRLIWEKYPTAKELREHIFDLMNLIAQHRRSTSPSKKLSLRKRVPFYDMASGSLPSKPTPIWSTA